ncbi:HPr family phosphocarrier protein [Desulfococcus sp.]|uniref:HPr family phosphocarrier protein n=1 Tax=Desulfococcus sp. TaxID=2025834 RepID=UPI00359302CD
MIAAERRAEDHSFTQKVHLFSRDYLRCCLFILGPGSPEHGYEFTKKLFSKLIGTSQVLEDFLDFHGAKNNKEWYLYRELCAAVRHLSLGGYSQKHILNRLVCYDLKADASFETEGRLTLEFLTRSLIKIAPVILDEAKRLGIPVPGDEFEASDFPGIVTGTRLEYNIDDEEKTQPKKHIVKIASEFLKIGKHFDQFGYFDAYDPARIRSLVPEMINEVEVRRYEMLVHNLQSSFDTYVIHGGYISGERQLKSLRSHFSVVFHLLQSMGRFLHFYERHLHEAGYRDIYKSVRNQLSFLVDPDRLLDRTINYGLYWVCHFFSQGKDIAQAVLNENIERDVIQVGVPVPRGFHSRPSLLVAKIVQYYGGKVELCAGEGRFDASSVLDIQWAGGKIKNENITLVRFEGDARSLRDLKVLANSNYGEDIMGNGVSLPRELAYLHE